MIVSGIEGSSFLDYPGMLSCVLFTQGCNYDCFYCHNRGLIGYKNGFIGYQEIERFLKKRVGFLQAVVISGGEPTLHGSLHQYFSLVKSLGYLTKLDTNGSRPKVLLELLEAGLLHYVAMDVKAPWERYREIAGKGADPANVQRCVSLLQEYQVMHPFFRWEVRTTLAPTLGESDLLEIAGMLPKVNRWVLNFYRKPAEYKEEDGMRINQPALSEREVACLQESLLLLQPNLKRVR
nr:anaerobic ribonucleoside-triphosphate reductase activating protein [uncultured Sphaerochaeta sp.]